MNKAKAAVSEFLSKDGKHDTTVHETVNPAVQNERVARTQHENATTAVDREVHQDHYHTSVQPVKHQEVLPEQHSHQMAGVENREINHGNPDHVKQRLEAERAQFKNTREVGETQHTSSVAPSVQGEHIHHHVHESIQPVIQKETVQPSVVHTTIPVHEVHHNEAKHHTASALPAVSMAEFKQQGGALGGREERQDAFAGEPRSVGNTLGGQNSNHTLGGPGAAGTTSVTGERGVGHDTTGNHGTRGTTGGLTGNNTSGSSGLTGHNNNTVGSTGSTGTGRTTGTTGTTGTTTDTTTGKKPGLLDRLNPMKDSDHDGKKGMMD